jgi:hypothetical protein
MTRRMPLLIRLVQPLGLALALAACGADGEPEPPARNDTAPAVAPLLSAAILSR